MADVVEEVLAAAVDAEAVEVGEAAGAAAGIAIAAIEAIDAGKARAEYRAYLSSNWGAHFPGSPFFGAASLRNAFVLSRNVTNVTSHDVVRVINM